MIIIFYEMILIFMKLIFIFVTVILIYDLDEEIDLLLLCT